ncbi:plasmid partitioning protein RepB [Aquamicrobium sp. NLF2-7]|uniref:plasmid partitioning protein RepB n=1 Tax=Aquamicrobium sp. NLF2-7 TaxID=2918753 RepID=UPI001EFC14E3|nr:plasmid partitioning protein RepB [Aquamicrobium sp. NLF2-7]MCG8273831.1 plasmid partitioning protein RepB [Aquamicrobium sp. NLF2-7]
MSKRTQSIRSMFAAKDDVSSTDNTPRTPRVASGAIRSVRETISEVEKDYQLLKEQLSAGAVAVDVDANLIDPSPFADRFVDQDEAAFQALVESIRDQGQEVPVLLREHPTSPGRYQAAYGHRRVKALQKLGRPVKAFVRDLTNEKLVLAQGLENSAREDLTFIERATFAVKLEDSGFDRSVVQVALAIDRAEASKLIAVARQIPAHFVDAIGRAPKIGRGRWQSFADALSDEGALERVRIAVAEPAFRNLGSDDRFLAVWRSATAKQPISPAAEAPVIAKTETGREFARLKMSSRAYKIEIDKKEDPRFAVFLMEKLPDLYREYINDKKQGED